MNVLLVQPPETALAVPGEMMSMDQISFSPPWNLLCLRSYIRQRTRHTAEISDARFFNDLEKNLVRAITRLSEPRAVVVNTSSLTLGEVAAVLEIAKRNFAGIPTILCGQYPSQFPQYAAAMPRTDFILAGDPEPILHALLDYFDMPARLRRVPGLAHAGGTTIPVWMPKLHSLALPEWHASEWSAYMTRSPLTRPPGIRITRGQSHAPADRASGESYAPLREWPFERVAKSMQKMVPYGSSEVFIADPPGIWTEQRLLHWCRTLRREDNILPWGLELLPTLLAADELEALHESNCKRVEFTFPSCHHKTLSQYGCIINTSEMAATINALRKRGIRVILRFWLNGPEEHPGEAHAILQVLRNLGYPDFSLHPFPYRPDAPIFQQRANDEDTPDIEEWIMWSKEPWLVKRPIPLWGGATAMPKLQRTYYQIIRHAAYDPRRVLRSLLRHLRSRNWITYIEDKSLGMSISRRNR